MSGWLDAVAASQQRQGIRDLIVAEKVRGTPVFAEDGAQLGVVEELVLDKREGRVADGQGADLQLAHQLRRLLHRGVGRDELHLPAHHLLDPHAWSPAA